ncbi:MAG: hypothetical protein QOE15_2586 [Acidimicrobiaceae bacterium]|nr:hypothetical protein [Acidimicrobiaceae bacterium]
MTSAQRPLMYAIRQSRLRRTRFVENGADTALIRFAIERLMAWHILTALGDALWRTEAGVALLGGGTATTLLIDSR